MAHRPSTPQEKKQLALARDIVDSWGESRHGFRKVKPQRKAQRSRAYRRAVTMALHEGSDPAEAGIARKPVTYWTGPRLGDYIKANLESRATLEANPHNSADARRRRQLRRGRETRSRLFVP